MVQVGGNDPLVGRGDGGNQNLVEEQCPVDGCKVEICGGPHKEVFTDIGWEVLKVGEEPRGKPLEPTEEDLGNRWSVKFRSTHPDSLD